MTTTPRHPPPPEPAGGQDGPPNLARALAVTLQLLSDLDGYIGAFRGDPVDLRLRLAAVSSVLRRIGNGLPDGR